MNRRVGHAVRVLAFGLALGLAGCAQPVRTSAPVGPTASSWSGRLALQVEDNSTQPVSAGFELRGNAEAGEMTLLNPLGGTLAALVWAPGTATLRSSSGPARQFESLEALAAHVTGTPIPVAALFDWLAGIDTPVPGWQADLSQLSQGRVRARRLQPLPVADLRLALDR